MFKALEDLVSLPDPTAGYVADAFGHFTNFDGLLYVVGATLLGITIGVLPGLTATMGVALLTTLTYQLDKEAALCARVPLCRRHLRRQPHRHSAQHPRHARQRRHDARRLPVRQAGRAGPAMGTATTGSFLGTLIGMVFLATVAPKLADYALAFQTHEFLWLAVFGILISGQLTAMDDPLKGWIAGFLGLRRRHGRAGRSLHDRPLHLRLHRDGGRHRPDPGDGRRFRLLGSDRGDVQSPRRDRAGQGRLVDVIPDPREIVRYWRTIGRSGLIGTLIGVIPGVGEDIGAWVSYAAARRASKEKEKYGKGSVEGLMAAETGNSAAAPGALIPVLTLGIPGSAPAAVLLAAMVLHGVRPGPMIMIEFPSFVYEVVVMMFLAAIAMLVLGHLADAAVCSRFCPSRASG